VVGAPNGIAGTVFDSDWHDQLPDYLVDHWFGSFRGNNLIANQAETLSLNERYSSS